jgi:hypothetical protein
VFRHWGLQLPFMAGAGEPETAARLGGFQMTFLLYLIVRSIQMSLLQRLRLEILMIGLKRALFAPIWGQ